MDETELLALLKSREADVAHTAQQLAALREYEDAIDGSNDGSNMGVN